MTQELNHFWKKDWWHKKEHVAHVDLIKDLDTVPKPHYRQEE